MRRPGDAAGEEAPDPGMGVFRDGLRGGQDLVPLAKPLHDFKLHRGVSIRGRRLPVPVRRHALEQISHRPRRQGAPAGHHRGVGEQVVVVPHVAQVRTQTPSGHCLVTLVDRDRARVRHDGVLPMTEPHIDVRRHMHQMTQPGREDPQLVRGRQRPFGMRRRFVRMHGQVIGQGVTRIETQGRLERRDDDFGARLRTAILVPEVPRTQHHPRIGAPRGHVGILRIILPDPAHRLRIGPVETTPVLFGSLGKARRQRADQVSLHRRGSGCSQPLGLLQRLDRLFCAARWNAWAVDVGTARQSDPPPSHGARRVQPRRVLHRTQPLFEIEVRDQSHALIKVPLRFWSRPCDHARVRAGAFEQGRRRCGFPCPQSRPPHQSQRCHHKPETRAHRGRMHRGKVVGRPGSDPRMDRDRAGYKAHAPLLTAKFRCLPWESQPRYSRKAGTANVGPSTHVPSTAMVCGCGGRPSSLRLICATTVSTAMAPNSSGIRSSPAQGQGS